MHMIFISYNALMVVLDLWSCLILQLVHQEEELRREEEAYYQARREAARSAKALRQKDPSSKLVSSAAHKDPSKWLGEEDSDWEM